MISYLTLDDLLVIAEYAVEGEVLVRDIGLLESALARPRANFMGREAYPDLPTKAAALLHSLATNHALVDGNKRLAFLASAVFLRINGRDLTLSEDEMFDLVIGVADGTMRDVEKIAERIAAGFREV
ncbi:type II toxin-antitoxin system death-on-curing family toxin [Pseudonocardia halophobica]|uniref:Toxin Doc n=1 Tax=Pseudonocardia halophobica TaxID=29401 RepID=A0A9W6NZC2_9PSEU|nr:type II toxin-antitoxin system death-on-curing family toxin [Pseudonocardia halophobica]GLL14879.1 toxin Doc [Pseudonocardia halophobica]